MAQYSTVQYIPKSKGMNDIMWYETVRYNMIEYILSVVKYLVLVNVI